MRRLQAALAFLALALLPAASCSDDTSSGPGTIDIYLAGDLTPKTFTDGLSGQTPRNFKVALGKYYVMRSADDPSPALCFDLGTSEVVSDLSSDTLIGTCSTASIPSGVYTHGRVRVQWTEYTVSGALHDGGETLTGDFTLVRAYSDTVRDGVALAAGHGVIRFGEDGPEVQVTYPPPASGPGYTVQTVDGVCWMTFAYTHPLPIDSSNTGAHWSRFSWEIFEGFRWADLTTTGYAPGLWDVSTVAADTELVQVHGVTGYHTTSSVD